MDRAVHGSSPGGGKGGWGEGASLPRRIARLIRSTSFHFPPLSSFLSRSSRALKAMRDPESKELGVAARLTAGALAGIASVVSTYPLDLVRSRISIASASLYSEAKAAASSSSSDAKGSTTSAPAGEKKEKLSRAELRRLIEARQKKVPGIWAMSRKVWIEEGGLRAL